MEIRNIKKGDIVTYRSGRVNYVNKPFNYKIWYKKDLRKKDNNANEDIMEIKRYVKFLCFYRLKTIYKRVK